VPRARKPTAKIVTQGLFIVTHPHDDRRKTRGIIHPNLTTGCSSAERRAAGRQCALLTDGLDYCYIVGVMATPSSLGEFEQIVLLATLRLGENAYGVTILAEIATCTGRKPSSGALYTTLDRLETKGLVRSRMGDPTPQRGGRAKRFMYVTKKGRVAVTNAQRSYQSLLQGLKLFGGANA
jgi:PadR family transcriptional regulator, regulatory protein PadR